jgi:hypothetical protein
VKDLDNAAVPSTNDQKTNALISPTHFLSLSPVKYRRIEAAEVPNTRR